MVIAFLWFGLICCGVAIGFIYDHVQAPQSCYYMVAIGTLDVILLIYHRVYTRNWWKQGEKIKKGNKTRYSFRPFGETAKLSIVLFASSILFLDAGEVSWGFLIGSAMVMVSFFMATAIESDYVC
jgi:hypothetical protein